MSYQPQHPVGLGPPYPGCHCLHCQQLRQPSPGNSSTYSQWALLQETQPPSQLLPKEIVAAPVEGWRIWQVYPAPQFARLGAVGIGPVRWDRVERAQCCTNVPPHSAPFAGCDCGLWAFKDDSRVTEALRRYALPMGDVYGYGRVQLWGRIIECEHGWRGEYARPLQVTLLGADDKTAQEIHEFYGCEVTVEDVPEWLRAERAKYWQPHRMNIQPGGPPVVFPTKRRRPSSGALVCLGIAIFNVVFACFEAFVVHTSSWVVNAATAAVAFVLSWLCWTLP